MSGSRRAQSWALSQQDCPGGARRHRWIPMPQQLTEKDEITWEGHRGHAGGFLLDDRVRVSESLGKHGLNSGGICRADDCGRSEAIITVSIREKRSHRLLDLS